MTLLWLKTVRRSFILQQDKEPKHESKLSNLRSTDLWGPDAKSAEHRSDHVIKGKQS